MLTKTSEIRLIESDSLYLLVQEVTVYRLLGMPIWRSARDWFKE